ncbi:hypothetical protein MKX08_005993 [Trichoderma sp. CBMAI-0020]|nr:hypothetical protein MKX08_005993 [Trichoderma sp. CBMAI-0020]
MQLDCVIAPTPASRRTKSQLQRELEDFRRRAELDRDEGNGSRSNSPTRQSGDVDGVSASAPASVPFMVADSVSAPLFVPALTPASEGIAAGLQPQTSPSISTRSNNHQSTTSQNQAIEPPATSQLFDGQDVAGRKIQDCFNLIGLAEGIMPLGLNDALTLPVQSEGDDGGGGCELDSPQDTKVYLKLCEIMICATEALKRAHSGSDSKNPSSLLSCISLFDTQLTKAAVKVQTTVDSIYYQCYRLYLLAYHFLVDAAFRKPEGFISLYAVACNLVNTVCQRSEAEESVPKIAPAFIQKTIVLASCTILKIHRSELAPHLDLEAGEQAYFASIVFAREGSIQNNDLSARGATIFSQLWNSQKIFRGKDGKIDSLSSRISSRLSTSVVFDCLWWWRQEFGGSGNPYENRRQLQVASSMANSNDISLEQRTDANTGNNAGALDVQQTASLTDEPFVDFDWDISLNLNEWPL